MEFFGIVADQPILNYKNLPGSEERSKIPRLFRRAKLS
jgi:hypothetical protein